eukprot:Gregarina_sp_Pseudo_9__3104@NODE_32_length_5543_cov_23_716206_g30_i0_p2_GENE_NODE_32_length_5543_cov_23_716206_g30_i0NODE_32_length_5543_cov_23_716206_g30_i0_p2_ORF_typecomplete_len368_score26_27zfCCCH/PF00642_24/1_4e06zfCCCH/PF00642_24/9_1e08zfCCCH/PF00642_24/1_9e05zfCCCH_3/PF15663_5/1_2e07zfCCCH_3/PF15663_5/9_3e07Torus/PF16131_5/0_0014Torus/PF16131_5/0_2Torus/PF16131_5/0_32zfCCCH_4/PF18044_1/0_94zfCCCH_4/PF18044_1/0_015zfCCCH_4/PF18044_1/0_018zf_CCCH_4/PF18345_1/0_0076zf_CCCH_4/PF18345_1/0_000
MADIKIMKQQQPTGAVSLAIARQSSRQEDKEMLLQVAVSGGATPGQSAPQTAPSSKRRRGNGRRVHKNNRVSSVLQSRMLKTKLCRWMSQGRCEKGAECSFAHSEAELRACPDLTKTRMCASYEQRGTCSAGERCRFAHTEDELRGTEEFYRTALCEDWMKGCCKLKERCRFAHGQEHLHQKPAIDEIATRSRVESDLNAAAAAAPGLEKNSPTESLLAVPIEMTAPSSCVAPNGGLTSPSSCKETTTARSSRSSTVSWDSSGTEFCRDRGMEDMSRWWALELSTAMTNELSSSVEAAYRQGDIVAPTALQVRLFEILSSVVNGTLEVSDADIQCIELFYSIHKRLQSASPSIMKSAAALLDPRFFY